MLDDGKLSERDLRVARGHGRAASSAGAHGRAARCTWRARTDIVIHRHQHRRQPLRCVAQLLRIAHAHTVPLAPFHGLRDRHPANRRGDDGLNVGDVHAVARRSLTIDVDVEVITAHGALGEGAPRSRNHPRALLDLFADRLEHGEIGAEDLDTDGCSNPRGQHVDASSNRHRPGIGDAGHLRRRVHLRNEAVVGYARPPLRLRLERDRRLEHVESGGIGCRLRASRLAPHVVHFGERLEDRVLLSNDLSRARHRHAGKRRRHEENRSLLERWHELAPDLRPGHPRQYERHDASHDHWSAMREDKVDHRTIHMDQESVQWIRSLAIDLSAHEEPHRHRHECQRQQTRRRH